MRINEHSRITAVVGVDLTCGFTATTCTEVLTVRGGRGAIAPEGGDDTKVSELSGSREPKGDILGIECEFAPLERLEYTADGPLIIAP